MATSQNHLEALNKPEWIQLVGQWVACPLLSKLLQMPLQVRAACTVPCTQGVPDRDTGGRDWGLEEKGTTEDEMAGWHH